MCVVLTKLEPQHVPQIMTVVMGPGLRRDDTEFADAGGVSTRHCEERSHKAIQLSCCCKGSWIASLRGAPE
jgi:hypothetical protein